MPREPFCFIHASGLHLDGPLEDIGALPDDLRNTVEDATLSAFENLIRECLEREAAFLLLAGESFEERRRSLRARVALVNGLRRLDEHGVRVFVMPGEADPAIAWHAIDGLPKNVTLLTPHSEGPILIERDRRAIAWLAAGPANESASGDRSGGPVRIGVCSPRHSAAFLQTAENREHPASVEYLVLSGPGRRTTLRTICGTAHHPGGTQGLLADDAGPHGATLVTVDSDGAIGLGLLPTAVVRRERPRIVLDAHATRDALAERMRSALHEFSPTATERVHLIAWTIRGTGALFESLHEEGGQESILATVGPSDGEPRLVHTVRLLPDGGAETWSDDESPAAGYFAALAEERPLTAEALRSWLDVPAVSDEEPQTEWERRLPALAARLDLETIDARARRLGAEWFS